MTAYDQCAKNEKTKKKRSHLFKVWLLCDGTIIKLSDLWFLYKIAPAKEKNHNGMNWAKYECKSRSNLLYERKQTAIMKHVLCDGPTHISNEANPNGRKLIANNSKERVKLFWVLCIVGMKFMLIVSIQVIAWSLCVRKKWKRMSAVLSIWCTIKYYRIPFIHLPFTLPLARTVYFIYFGFVFAKKNTNNRLQASYGSK